MRRRPFGRILGLLGAGGAMIGACVIADAGEGTGSSASSASTGGHGGGGGGATTTGTFSGGGGTMSACGNKMIDDGEDCDDGQPSDTCSADCKTQSSDKCPGAAIPLSPPGLTITGTLEKKP